MKRIQCSDNSSTSRRKREDGSCSCSWPETTKPSKVTGKHRANDRGHVARVKKIQENTDMLLKENKNLRSLYQDLTQSLELHVKKIEDLKKENKTLREEVDFLQEEASAVKSIYNDATMLQQM